MTAGIGSAATRKVVERLTGSTDASATAGSLTAAGFEGAVVRAQNAAADIVERAGAARYPVVSVYCEKVVNDLREKFRRFSGRAQIAIEVRHSQDRLDGMEDTLEQQTDAITQALGDSRGDWGDGMYYAGAYEVTFGRVARGGKNFTQVAKVTFEIGVNRN
jgi:hypothetical protein